MSTTPTGAPMDRIKYAQLFMSGISKSSAEPNKEEPKPSADAPPSQAQQNLADMQRLDDRNKAALSDNSQPVLSLLNLLSQDDEKLKGSHDALLNAVRACGDLGGTFLGDLYQQAANGVHEDNWSEKHIHEHSAVLRKIVKEKVKELIEPIVDSTFDGDIYNVATDPKKGGPTWGEDNRYTNDVWTFAALSTFIDRQIGDATNAADLAKFEGNPLMNEANRKALEAKKLELNQPPKTTADKLKDLLAGDDPALMAEVANLSSAGDFPAALEGLQDKYQTFVPVMPLVESIQAPADDVAAAALFAGCAEFFTEVKAAFKAKVGNENLHEDHGELNDAIMEVFKAKFEAEYADSLDAFDGKFFSAAKQAEAANGNADWDGGDGWAKANRYRKTEHFAAALEAHHAALLREAIQAL